MTLLALIFPHAYKWLPVVEGLIALGAVYAAVGIRLGFDPSVIDHHIGTLWLEALIFAGFALLSLTIVGLYNSRLRIGIEAVMVRLGVALLLTTALLTILYYTVSEIFLGRGILGLSLVLTFVPIALLRWQVHRIWLSEGWQRKVLVLGAGRRAARLAWLRRRTDLIGLRLVGFVPNPGDDVGVDAGRIIEPDRPLAEWACAMGVVEIVVAPDERRDNVDSRELLACRRRGVAVCDLLSFHERETGQVCLDHGLSSWLAFSNATPAALAGDRVKRVFDIVVSLTLALITAPLLGLAMLAIWIESGLRGPILYGQTRVGFDGRPFELWKLRTMVTDAESDGTARWARANDPRVTRVGRILRRFRVDELPQLYNVLRGDMSFVGPRPERPEFVEKLIRQSPFYSDRHSVKPGLAGWAQIRYPYAASESDALRKLQYDLYYVKNRSLYLDLVILLQTAEVVLWGKGVR